MHRVGRLGSGETHGREEDFPNVPDTPRFIYSISGFKHMETWESALSLKQFEDYYVKKCPVPVHNPEDQIKCLNYCRENVCGQYDTNWGCPPGFSAHVEEFYSECDYVLLVRRTFCLDVKDEEVVKATTAEMQRITRMMMLELRDNGIRCKAFADGGCRYCGVCSYPEPCKFPEMFMPSVSSLGLNIGNYLESLGEPFAFSDDCVTLYGMIFVAKE